MNFLSKLRFGELSSAHRGTAALLSPHEAAFFNRAISDAFGVEYERLFFGHAIVDALEHGYQITHSGYFEATECPAALQTARTLAHKFRKSPAGTPAIVIDLFAGTGQTAWAFGRCGFRVGAFENDFPTFSVARSNLLTSGLANQISLRCTDGVDWIFNEATEKVFAVYLDPPWKQGHSYEASFSLDSIDISLARILTHAQTLARVIALKLPANYSREETVAMATDLQCNLLLEYHHIEGFIPELNQVTAYFSRTECEGNSPQIIEEHVQLSRPERSACL